MQAAQHQRQGVEAERAGGDETQQGAVRERGRQQEEEATEQDGAAVFRSAQEQGAPRDPVGAQRQHQHQMGEDRVPIQDRGVRDSRKGGQQGHQELGADDGEKQAFPELAFHQAKSPGTPAV